MRNILHNGIIFDLQFVDRASASLRRTTNLFRQLRYEADTAAREVPRSYDRATGMMGRMTRLLQTDVTQAMRTLRDETDRRFYNFTRTTRQMVNNFHSIIMGGVAVAMSGLGIRRAGDSILRTINGWVEGAEEFRKVMTQVKFLGQVTEKEFKRLEDRVIQIGISLPVSNLQVAEGVLMALKTGFDAVEAEFLARPIAMLSFFSDGALDVAESTQFLNSILKQTGYDASEADMVLDKLTKTMQVTSFSMGEIWQTWKSSRSAFGNLRTDLDSFLTLLGVARTSLNPRYAGMLTSQWASGVLTAYSSPGKKGELWRLLGIDLEAVGKDPLKVLEMVVERSKALWGDSFTQRAELKNIFGVGALPMIQAYENYLLRAKNSAEDIREIIKDSAGFAEEYMNVIMNTSWGLRQVLEGTRETFRQTMGDLFAPVLIPLLKGLQSVMASLTEFIRKYPTIAKVFGYGLGLTGLFMSAAGAAMLLGGQILSIYGSLNNALLQTAILNFRTAESLDALGQGSITVGQLIRNKFMLPMGKALKTLAALGATSLFVYMAWRYDFFRLRTITTEFFNNFKNSIDKARNAMMTMEPAQLGNFVRELLGGEYWDRFTVRLIQALNIWDALITAVRTYREFGAFRITDDQYQILQQLGLLDTVGKLIDGIAALNYFWNGFINGMRDGFEFITKILRPLGWIIEKIYEVGVWIGQKFGFFATLNRPDVTLWESIGEKVGFIASMIIGIRLGLAGWKYLLAPIASFFGSIASSVRFIFGRIGGGGAGGVGGVGGAGGSGGTSIFSQAVRLGRRGLGAIGSFLGSGLSSVSPRAYQSLFGAGVAPTFQRGVSPFANMPFSQIPRVKDFWWNSLRAGMHPMSGVVLEKKGLIPSLLFGKQAYSKTGQHIGQTAGLMTPFMKLGQKFPMLGKIPWLQAAIMGHSIYKAPKGEKLGAGVKTGSQLVGMTLGSKVGSAIGGALFPVVGNIVGMIIGSILGSLLGSGLGEYLAKWAYQAVDWIKEGFGSLSGWFSTTWSNIGLGVSNFISNTITWFSTLPGKAKEQMIRLKDWAIEGILDLPYRVGYIIGFMVGSVVQYLSELPGKAYQAWRRFYEGTMEWLGNTYERATAWARRTMDSIYGYFSGLGERAYEWFKGFYDNTMLWLSQLPDKAVQFVDSLVKTLHSLKDRIPSFSDVVEWFSQIGKGIVEGIVGAYNSLKGFPKMLLEKAMGVGWYIGDKFSSGFSAGYKGATEPYARGGFITRPTMALMGEDGNEAVIPLSGKHRDRAISLWERVGELISAPGIYNASSGSSSGSTSGSSSSSTLVNFGEGSIVLEIKNTSDPAEVKRAAKQLFDEFKRLIEVENVRNYRPARA